MDLQQILVKVDVYYGSHVTAVVYGDKQKIIKAQLVITEHNKPVGKNRTDFKIGRKL